MCLLMVCSLRIQSSPKKKTSSFQDSTCQETLQINWDQKSLLSMLDKYITGLNTLGISLARIDYAPYGGLNPPHTHTRATEILVVLEGTLYVGFVTSNLDNRPITKVL
ncbi:hypothetical protein CRYUN_Cryun05aG0037100 [Craigia yunnanensis]